MLLPFHGCSWQDILTIILHACAELANVLSLSGLEDKSKKSKAERIAFDLLEYLDQINYNKYYESMGSPGTRGGEKEKLFSDFSSQSIKAAQVTYYSLQICAACSVAVCEPNCICRVWQPHTCLHSKVLMDA